MAASYNTAERSFKNLTSSQMPDLDPGLAPLRGMAIQLLKLLDTVEYEPVVSGQIKVG